MINVNTFSVYEIESLSVSNVLFEFNRRSIAAKRYIRMPYNINRIANAFSGVRSCLNHFSNEMS